MFMSHMWHAQNRANFDYVVSDDEVIAPNKYVSLNIDSVFIFSQNYINIV